MNLKIKVSNAKVDSQLGIISEESFKAIEDAYECLQFDSAEYWDSNYADFNNALRDAYRKNEEVSKIGALSHCLA